MASELALRLAGIRKEFLGVVANDNVTLEVRRGEVHALLGENGAGKSTLMKILYGYYQPDAGSVEIDGHPVPIHSPADARRLGIGMVFQSFMLIPALTVRENVALAMADVGAVPDWRGISRRIREVAARYGFEVDPKAPVWTLSVGEQQRVEIVRLLVTGARLLIFDEPTSVLAPTDVEALFRVFAHLKADGYTVVFITHKLREVLACADRVTVLRRGRVSGVVDATGATEADLVRMIVGVDPGADRPTRDSHQAHGDPILELRGISAHDDRGGPGLRGVSLALRAGEIVGLVGVSGNGQVELGDVALGVRAPTAGAVLLGGVDVTHWPIERRLAAGLGVLPDDPMRMAAVGAMSVQENLALGDLAARRRPGWLGVDWASARARAEWLTRTFGLAMPRLDTPLETLSGGNVQRIAFARELSRRPRALLVYHATRGLDIAAVEVVHRALRQARDEEAGVVVVSEDIDELRALCDRLLVIYHGEIVGETSAADADLHEIGLLMTTGRPVEAAVA